MLYDSPVNERMRNSPEFAAAESKVRGLERDVNTFVPRVDELKIQVSNLSQQIRFSDGDSPAGQRLTFSLNQSRADLKTASETLANIRLQLSEAITERDALFDPK